MSKNGYENKLTSQNIDLLKISDVVVGLENYARLVLRANQTSKRVGGEVIVIG